MNQKITLIKKDYPNLTGMHSSLAFKVAERKISWVAKIIIAICFLIIVNNAQSQTALLPLNTTTVSGVNFKDYIIPDNINKVSITVVGARGESITILAFGCNKFGGRGASIGASFIVGDYACTSGKMILKPGGTLRFVIGKQGYNDNYSSGYVGNGGGGSAALYLAPGSSSWVILLVAGGGGGAGQFYNVVCKGFNGKDAELGESGSDGAGPNGGLGGSNGNGGFAGGIIDGDGGGGGGAFSQGQDGTRPGIGGKAGGNQGGNGGTFVVDNPTTYKGGFGFGGGGAAAIAGGGGGGYSGGGGGGKDGTDPGGGGGGGSYVIAGATDISKSVYGELSLSQSFPAFAKINAVAGNPALSVSLVSATLSPSQVVGCGTADVIKSGLPYSTSATAITSAQFNAAGGVVVQQGCTAQTITYIDVLDASNNKIVHRSFTVTDGGGNTASCTQDITIINPAVSASVNPKSQIVCVDVAPATITVDAFSAGGITVQWYQSESLILSEATPIQGAVSGSYTPLSSSVEGIIYYLVRVVDGCGTAIVKNAKVTVVAQPSIWYKDADNDGYSDGASITQCIKPVNYKLQSELIAISGDCDDNVAAINPTIIWYKDADNDGYSDGAIITQCERPDNYKLQSELIAISGDCNDNDLALNPQTDWVLDVDNDGYYSGIPVTSCTSPGAGYRINANQVPGDCNDNDAAIHAPVQYYVDGDGDGYGSTVTAMFCSSTAPAGYSVNNTDCNDNDATVKGAVQYYVDGDGDGYGSTVTAMLCSSTAPVGYAVNNTDCNDNDAATNPATVWYEDRDNDGYSNLYTVNSCERPKIYYGGAFSLTFTYGKLASELINLTQDCDDTRANVNPGIAWYKDADNDGFSDGTVIYACYQPSNYKPSNEVSTGGDCDDNDSRLNPDTRWYADVDNDGYSNGSYMVQCLRPVGGKLPNELVATGGDCNDNDAAINPNTRWFKDADNDGYSDGVSIVQCAKPLNYKLPSELTSTFGDCNDNDATIHSPVLYYVDGDGDGYGSSVTAMLCSSTAPVGYAVNNTDCNDNDAATNPSTVWYEDRDNDGYSSLYTVNSCERPKIYYGGAFSFTFTYGKLASELTSLTQDCDDTKANVNPGIVWYKDADNDGFSDGTTQSACYRPSNYKLSTEVSIGGDCDDNDSRLNPNTRWYPDADNDGYSTGNYVVQCLRPAFGKLPNELIATSGDCNDNDATFNPNTRWFKDADNDGYSDGVSLAQCARPVNYKLLSELTAAFGDCNDNDASIHAPVQYYTDADHDGYGGTTTALLCSLTAPAGYSTNNTDCDDNNAAVTPLTIWYKDADNDGYSDGTTVTQCTQPAGYKLATALTATTGDCNDSNAALNPATVWYEDRDGDGYSSLVTRTQCEQPKFYYGGALSTTYTLGKLASQLNSLVVDCDDTRATVNPGVAWYKDADNDGYSDGTRLFACTRPTGYKLATEVNISGDCNDADYRINPNTVWYRDNDNDGYSNGTTLRQCTQPTGYKLAAALAATSGDCNDDNAAINPNTIWLKDADNDGYSDGTSRRQCTQPAGYKLPSNLILTYGDCNDNNPSLNPATIWIVDRDEDGYYTGSPVTRCTSPGNNYIIKTTQLPGDCSDNNASVNPGAVEVCGNGIDDNCNGIIDETTCYPCQNAANLQTTNITSGTAQLNWIATANPVQWQLQYKKNKQGASWQDVFVGGNKRSVVINSLSSGQNYLWQIRAKCGNNWTVYSAPASFRTTGGSTLSRPAPATPETVEINTGNISVYPNPTNGMFTIALRLNNSTTTAIISLTDATGSTIYKQKANVLNGKLNQRIQMPANAASGVYILQVNADGESYQSRLVYIK